jgi:hypothetical protein
VTARARPHAGHESLALSGCVVEIVSGQSPHSDVRNATARPRRACYVEGQNVTVEYPISVIIGSDSFAEVRSNTSPRKLCLEQMIQLNDLSYLKP